MKSFKVYLLYSAIADKYYVGSTGDKIENRVSKHNSDHKGFTGGKGDWKLKYLEYFEDTTEALKREKKIKKWKSRKMIENLIHKNSAGSVHLD